MVYTRGVPSVTDTKSGSRPKIAENFDDIDDSFRVDHVPFNGVEGGRHDTVSLMDQGGDATVGAAYGAVYSKTENSRINPYYRFNSTGGAWDEQVAPLLPVKAFVQFDNAGNVAGDPDAPFNVSSVTVNGTGDFSVNLSNQMADTDGVIVATCSNDNFPTNRVILDARFTNDSTVQIRSAKLGSAVLQNAKDYHVVVLGV